MRTRSEVTEEQSTKHQLVAQFLFDDFPSVVPRCVTHVRPPQYAGGIADMPTFKCEQNTAIQWFQHVARRSASSLRERGTSKPPSGVSDRTVVLSPPSCCATLPRRDVSHSQWMSSRTNIGNILRSNIFSSALRGGELEKLVSRAMGAQRAQLLALKDEALVNQGRNPVNENSYLCAQEPVRRKDDMNRDGLCLPVLQHRQ